MFYSGLIFSLLAVKGIVSVSLVAVSVPHHRGRGENATLLCEYRKQTKGGGELYSLKWYKDEKEFYRFQPWNMEHGQVQMFDLPGVRVDPKESKPESIVLKRVNFRSSGIYRCEITTTDFDIQEKYAQMTVIELPQHPPVITITDRHHNNLSVPYTRQREHYEVGDMLELTCNSHPSNPTATLRWEINKQDVPKKYVIHYPRINHSKRLWVSKIGLKIQLQKEHFKWGKLKVACLGEISAIFWKSGVDEYFLQMPDTQYRVLASSEGIWIANGAMRRFSSDLVFLFVVLCGSIVAIL